jgi:hypothetical protein
MNGPELKKSLGISIHSRLFRIEFPIAGEKLQVIDAGNFSQLTGDGNHGVFVERCRDIIHFVERRTALALPISWMAVS